MFQPKTEEVIEDYNNIRAPIAGTFTVRAKPAILANTKGLFKCSAIGKFI